MVSLRVLNIGVVSRLTLISEQGGGVVMGFLVLNKTRGVYGELVNTYVERGCDSPDRFGLSVQQVTQHTRVSRHLRIINVVLLILPYFSGVFRIVDLSFGSSLPTVKRGLTDSKEIFDSGVSSCTG